jgi:hypothetical protein
MTLSPKVEKVRVAIPWQMHSSRVHTTLSKNRSVGSKSILGSSTGMLSWKVEDHMSSSFSKQGEAQAFLGSWLLFSSEFFSFLL